MSTRNPKLYVNWQKSGKETVKNQCISFPEGMVETKVRGKIMRNTKTI